jgi:hypothetical protein
MKVAAGKRPSLVYSPAIGQKQVRTKSRIDTEIVPRKTQQRQKRDHLQFRLFHLKANSVGAVFDVSRAYRSHPARLPGLSSMLP